MKNLILLSVLVYSLSSQICNAQILIIGFDPPECGILLDHGYSFSNTSCSHSHCYGYSIYLDGNVIYNKFPSGYGAYFVKRLVFINETTGFLVEDNAESSVGVFKTSDSGKSWNFIGSGLPEYLNFYVVNENTGYLYTSYSSSSSEAFTFTRVSDLYDSPYKPGREIMRDTLITDTIFGPSFCELDTLGIKVLIKNDTIDFKINYQVSPLGLNDVTNEDKFQIAPNPVRDYIYINVDNTKFNKPIINIYNYLGIKMRSLKLEANDRFEIYAGDLQKGYYLIEISDGKKRIMSPIIKN